MKKTLFLLFVFSISAPVFGQKSNAEKDSLQLYDKIATYSQKSKFTKLIHRWVFRSNEKNTKRTVPQKVDYGPYGGKIIRKIIIHSLDPFGNSVTDTTVVAKTWLERTGNKIHVKSQEMAIRNFLLLKEDEPLDTLLISESARLLRAQNYIREVRIEPKFVSNSQDSVDVTITTLDSWSLIPTFTFSQSYTDLGLRERNILGTGHQMNLEYSKRLIDGEGAVEASYRVPNFKNTFINGLLEYKIDYDEYFEKTFSVGRDFYSPLTQWAGGIMLQERLLHRFFPDDTLDLTHHNLRFVSQDYWAGHAFRLFKGSSQRERTTNLIISARVLRVNFRETPGIQYDKINYFSNENFYLISTGIASRQYEEDSYIFRDGITEDVPVGVVYSITGGVQHKNNKDRMYLGAQVFYANYFKWGFLSTNFEVGSFFNGSKTQQTAYSFSLNYFSNLIDLGNNWKMRQFIKPQFIIGTNRLNYIGDRLSLNENPDFNANYNDPIHDGGVSIRGFESHALGTKKYILSLQTQFYSPWDFLGFRLNPFINLTSGMLSGGEFLTGEDKLYSSLSAGVVIRNDYLVFDSFQLSFSFYPQIPGQGRNIIKTNAFENDDFGFQDFHIGKPKNVLYK